MRDKIIELYPHTPNRELAARFNLSISKIKNLAAKFKLAKSPNYKRTILRLDAWSTAQIEFLKYLYPNTANKELAEMLQKSISMVKNKAYQLKLKKHEDISNAGRFTKGHVPWTKGRKGLRHSPSTEFKKGQKPWNTKQNGCVTVRFDKSKSRPYKFIRLEENTWVHLHRHLYLKHYGSIPENHVIIFSDGNSMNLNIENLIPVTRYELMIRNYGNRPKDHTELYHYLINRLNKLREVGAVYRAPKPKSQKEILKARSIRKKKSLRAEFITEQKNQRKLRRDESKKQRHIQLERRRNNRKRVGAEFIEAKLSTNYLMDMGENNLGLAIKFMRDMDNAKDAIMNVVCYFVEGNLEATNEEFKKRLIYECKLLSKESYKKISFHDIEYKLTGLEEVL